MNIHGRNPVIEALKAGKEISKIYFRYGTHGQVLKQIEHLARKAGVPTVTLPKQKFDRLEGGNDPAAQGVVALIEDVRIYELDDLLEIEKEQDPPFFVALDSITDPHNVGAIIRSAECAGAHGIILPKHDTPPLTDVVMKASAGAATHIPIAKVTNLRTALEKMKTAGIWIAGLAGEGEVDLFTLDGFKPLCIVVGSEGRGIRPTNLKACDELVRIPMWGRIESLNASVAAAVAMYEVRRKRV
ncbi:MAG: 23S rRNA (guanosine(2251)-2'-O)-methyltransferase RlmB [Ectothiorhodospiraceae bacterium]|nr:23S rRNA (guanosine(2251)-2'-O)-methyltransferase RlmB [Ectothiorhodospiraceae bacterium]